MGITEQFSSQLEIPALRIHTQEFSVAISALSFGVLP